MKMNYMNTVLIIGMYICLANAASSHKFKDGVKLSQNKVNFDKPFKMNKLNLVWEKALKRLSVERLADLRTELLVQDELEINAKKQRADGYDEDGYQAALVRQKLLDILSKYELKETENVKEDKVENLTIDKASAQIEGMENYKMDKKLKKIWEKAQSSGFSKTELDALRMEFLHHQQKLDEFNQFRSESNHLPDTENDDKLWKKDISDPVERQRKKILMKQKWQDIKDSYDALENFDVLKDASFDFTEPKVDNLWKMARSANFSEQELESFKEELKHFEHKIKKHNYLSKELSHSAQLIKKDSKPGDPHVEEKIGKMEEKVSDYAKKIKKVHSELKERIKQFSHNEL